MTEPVDDPNIFRCALKKSVVTAKKHILYASCAIVAITALVISSVGIYGIWQAAYPIITRIIEAIAALAPPIPWYYYIVPVAIAAYYGYGLVWCIARELTEEDWQSDEARALFIAALVIAVLIIGISSILCFITFHIILVIFAAIGCFALVVILNAIGDPIYSKIFLFIGAYLHYRNRIKKQKEITS